MKKIIFTTLAMFCLAGICHGQTPSAKAVQRPVGDTITDANVDYYFDEYDFLGEHCSDLNWVYHPAERGILDQTCNWTNIYLRNGNVIYGTQMYAQRPLKVVGLAACCYAQNAADTTTTWTQRLLSWEYMIDNMREDVFFRNTLDERLSSRLTDSLIIYSLDGEGPHWLASGPWRAEDPHRNILLKDQFSVVPYRVVNTSYMGGENPTSPWTTDSIFPLYEVMFKSPVYVHGSFMVAGTALNNQDTHVYCTPPNFPAWAEYMDLWKVRPTRYFAISAWEVPEECDEGPNGRWWKCLDIPSDWTSYLNTRWQRLEDERYLGYCIDGVCIFPIIDTTFDSIACDGMGAVRMSSRTDTSLTLTWDGGNNVEWMLRYVEAGTTDTLTAYSAAPTYTIEGLRPYTSYYVWVCARCDSTREFGEWSDLTPATTMRSQTPEGIDPTSSTLFTLTPNPAKDYVAISCQPGIGRAEVTMSNTLGQEVRRAEMVGGSIRISLQSLPSGVYLVTLKSAQGSSTQRLVVE